MPEVVGTPLWSLPSYFPAGQGGSSRAVHQLGVLATSHSVVATTLFALVLLMRSSESSSCLPEAQSQPTSLTDTGLEGIRGLYRGPAHPLAALTSFVFLDLAGTMWGAPSEWDFSILTEVSCRRRQPQHTTAAVPAKPVCPHLPRTPRSR